MSAPAMPQGTSQVAPPRVVLKSPAREAVRRLLRKPQAMLGGVLLVVMILSAIFAPAVAPFSPYVQGIGDPLAPPSPTHRFGTDQFGRDVFSRVVHGGRVSLQLGLISVAIGGSLGLLIGSLAGYLGGRVEEIGMRLVDIMLAFPGILLALAIVILLGPGLYNLMIAVGIGAIPTIARVVRASVLDVKSRDYIAAARALGIADGAILLRHILPNVMAPFIVLVTLDVATAILAGTSLSFLGIGVKPPSSEWGLMLTDARNFLRDAWWVGTFPGLAITVTVVGINLLGDGLRDALDPRLRGSR
jgi:peptide/nickel transport system permease protein